MPKSRTNQKPKPPVKTTKDIQKSVDAYYKKMDEYDQMSFEELLTLQKSGKVKGIYLTALINTLDKRTVGGLITPL